MHKLGRRLGLVFKPTGFSWHLSHCQTPFAQTLSPTRFRIHFACRDENNRSRGGWAEVDVSGDKLSVVRSAQSPSLGLGRLGAFDDCGAMPGCLVEHNDRLLLYYTGWTLARSVPFHFFIGLAESANGGETFERVSEAPILGRNPNDPFLTASPWVLKEGGKLRMWYTSGTAWVTGEGNEDPIHYYLIKHATSADGMVWTTNERFCLPYLEKEHSLARPVVYHTSRGYRMLFSARRLGETYRIYSARSADGLIWERDADTLLDVVASGWDSEMVCYGSLLDTGRSRFLLYNGNAYGKDGFGAARLQPSNAEGDRLRQRL